jgi:hypothetical protein
MADRRANYALVQFQNHLGGDEAALSVPWAEFVGDETDTREFEVTTDDPTETFLQLQAYDVDAFGHGIVVNGTPLSGFDIPPAEGWQCWMDAVSGVDLVEGTNTIRIERDETTTDSLVVGVVTVHWKEPAE